MPDSTLRIRKPGQGELIDQFARQYSRLSCQEGAYRSGISQAMSRFNSAATSLFLNESQPICCEIRVSRSFTVESTCDAR